MLLSVGMWAGDRFDAVIWAGYSGWGPAPVARYGEETYYVRADGTVRTLGIAITSRAHFTKSGFAILGQKEWRNLKHWDLRFYKTGGQFVWKKNLKKDHEQYPYFVAHHEKAEFGVRVRSDETWFTADGKQIP